MNRKNHLSIKRKKRSYRIRARIINLVFVGLLMVTMVGCMTFEKSTRSEETFVIGLMPSEDAIPFILAKDQGFYEKEGIDVQLEVFKSAKDRDAAFQAGNLDGIIGDQVAIALYQNADFDVKIVSYTDCDFYLIAGKDSGIQTINDLVNRSVAISENTVIEYTLDKMLLNNNIQSTSVAKTAIPPIPTRVEMLNNNKVDAALLPQPFATFAMNEGGILIDKASENGLRPSVIAFTQSSIDANKEQIGQFINAYNQAVQYANQTPITEYEDLVIDTVGYPEDMKGKITLPTFSEIALPSSEELVSAIEWVEDKELSKKSISPEDLIYQ